MGGHIQLTGRFLFLRFRYAFWHGSNLNPRI